MRRIIMLVTVALVMAAMMVAMALPALADNIKGDGGPPFLSGEGSANASAVVHCNALPGGESVAVLHKNGKLTGNCRF